MNHLALLFLFSAFTSSAQHVNSREINEKVSGKYPYSGGIVQYTITGEASGNSTLSFDRNGWRSLENRTLKLKRYGIESVDNTLELKDGDKSYWVNSSTLKGKKTADNRQSSLMAYKTNEEVVAILMSSMGGRLSGTDTLLDRACSVWEFEKERQKPYGNGRDCH